MQKVIGHYRNSHSPAFYKSLALSLVFFSFSLFLNYAANIYTVSHASGAIELHDIILDHVSLVNVDDIMFEGVIIFISFLISLVLYRPTLAPMLLKTSALFILVRSFFIILTHIAPPVHESYLLMNNALERTINGSGDDLFFSGHTGFPFLMALLFWESRPLRTMFIGTSIIFGAAVLFGHLHYSIDVFAAFFITYGIYSLAISFFKKDYEFFRKIEPK